jgi:hypothetical protein
MVGNVERLQTSAPANIIQNGIRVNEILEEKRGAERCPDATLVAEGWLRRKQPCFQQQYRYSLAYGCTKKLI